MVSLYDLQLVALAMVLLMWKRCKEDCASLFQMTGTVILASMLQIYGRSASNGNAKAGNGATTLCSSVGSKKTTESPPGHEARHKLQTQGRRSKVNYPSPHTRASGSLHIVLV